MQRLLGTIIVFLLPQLSNAIDPADVFHNSNSIFYVNPSVGEIKLKVKKGSIIDAQVIINSDSAKMEIWYRNGDFDYFAARLNKFDTTATYRFILKNTGDSLIFPATDEFKPDVPLLTPPAWAFGKIYYSIFIDGFYNGVLTNDPEEKLIWGTKPEKWRSYGGDLKGVLRKIAYIDSFNPDIIILQPIFSASSNHKFNPKDYASIDSCFGDTMDLKNLIDEVHKRDKKIILSVIFTHTGIDFPAFVDVVKKGKESKYIEWYFIKSTPITTSPLNYECWRSDSRFPKLNLRNPQVANYLIGFLEYWKHFGFDGFYIGEDEKIDADFILTLRTHLKTKYPDILLLGSDVRFLDGNGFDGSTNRNFLDILMKYFVKNTLTTSDFDNLLQKMFFFNAPQVNCMNLISLSDYDKRILGEADIIKNLYAFIFTCVGSPTILYGDEIGLSDYASLNQGSFIWNIDNQNRDLLKEIKQLIEIRNTNPQILSNVFFSLYANDITKVYAYDRGGLIVVLNSGDKQSFVELPAWDGLYLDLITGEKLTAYTQKLRLSISPKSYRILRREI
ncbi:Neopullulanase 2 [subsurface metagenome]